MGGNPGRRVREVPRAGEEEVGAAGAADADKHMMLSRGAFRLEVQCRSNLPAGVLEVNMWFNRCRMVLPIGLLLLATHVVLAGCSKSSKPLISVFRTPDDAGNALVAAAKSSDPTAAATVLPPRTETPNPSPGAPAEFKFNLTLTIRRSDQPLKNHPRRNTSFHHLR